MKISGMSMYNMIVKVQIKRLVSLSEKNGKMDF